MPKDWDEYTKEFPKDVRPIKRFRKKHNVSKLPVKDENGNWVPNPTKLGNPAFRSKDNPALVKAAESKLELSKAARAYTKEALLKIIEAMRGDDTEISMKAANIILDRGWGKAVQQTDMMVRDGARSDEQAAIDIAFIRQSVEKGLPVRQLMAGTTEEQRAEKVTAPDKKEENDEAAPDVALDEIF